MVPHDAARHFEAIPPPQRRLDLVDHPLDRLGTDRPLGTSGLDAGPKLRPIKLLPAPVLLHNNECGHLVALVGGEAAAALLTLSPTTRHRDVLRVALVEHACIARGAK